MKVRCDLLMKIIMFGVIKLRVSLHIFLVYI